MKYLTIDDIKQQLRLDFDCEDALLELYGQGAEDTVLHLCNRTYENLVGTYGEVPAAIRHATLELVTNSYEQRSPASPTNLSAVPYNFDLLVKPYMRLTSPDESEVQTVTLGSDVKIAFTADLPDGLLLKDVDFTVKVINMSEKDKNVEVPKADCIMTDEGASYVVLVDSETLGIGMLMLRLTVYIPDTDYQSGTRKEVIKINPHIKISG